MAEKYSLMVCCVLLASSLVAGCGGDCTAKQMEGVWSSDKWPIRLSLSSDGSYQINFVNKGGENISASGRWVFHSGHPENALELEEFPVCEEFPYENFSGKCTVENGRLLSCRGARLAGVEREILSGRCVIDFGREDFVFLAKRD